MTWPVSHCDTQSESRVGQPFYDACQKICSTAWLPLLLMVSQFLDAKDAIAHLATYPRSDGISVQELMDSQVNGGLTYNDFLLLPGKIDFPASDVVVDSRITKKVVLKTPFMSSPMDTVTGGEMAISMAVSTLLPFWQKGAADPNTRVFFY